MNTNQGAILVTGASRGLGLDMAKFLSSRGYRVFAGCRKSPDFSRLKSEDHQLVPLLLDVTDEDSIASAREVVANEVGEGGLQGLINNAGVFVSGPIEQVPLAEVEAQFRVNVWGPIAMIQQFLPLLRKGEGRIVNISSVNGFLSALYLGIYSASKFALEALSDALRQELKPWSIPVSVVQPGLYASEIRTRGVERWAERSETLPESERNLYQSGLEKTRRLIAGFNQVAADPRQVSETVWEALTASPPKTRYVVGESGKQLQGMLSLSDEERDQALLQMWDQS